MTRRSTEILLIDTILVCIVRSTTTSFSTGCGDTTYHIYHSLHNITEAWAACQSFGYTLASFADNSKFKLFTDYLDSNTSLAGLQIWVETTDVNGTTYFGSEAVDTNSWVATQPDNNCNNDCCCRVTSTIGASTYPYGLADNYCSMHYAFACEEITACSITSTPLSSPGVGNPARVESSARLPIGQQMSIVYFGLILGTSLSFSALFSIFSVLSGMGRGQGVTLKFSNKLGEASPVKSAQEEASKPSWAEGGRCYFISI